MSAVYVVIAIDHGADLTVCEVYAGAHSALGRASALAHYAAILNQDWVDTTPTEEKLPDGSIRWIFLDTSKKYIAVQYKHILISSSSVDPMEDLKMNLSAIAQQTTNVVAPVTPTINVAPDPIVTADAPYDDNLPGGWFLDNKPAKMIDLWETPEQVKSVYNLTKAQKAALVSARIMNRPGFSLYIPGLGTYSQTMALEEIKNKTSASEEIIEDECIWLEEVRQDRLASLEDDSSSEDSWV